MWERIAPLLPQVKHNPRYPGRLRLDDRKVLKGILFVLYTGIRWEFLPQELGYGSGMTCWRRLRDWNAAGVWRRLHELLLSELRGAGLLDLTHAAVDSSHLRAMKGGPSTGPSPVDRGKTGSKDHLIVETHGIPLAAITTGGNRNDVTQLMPLIEAVSPVRRNPRPTPTPPEAPVRRPWLRPRVLPRSGTRPTDHAAHCPARHRPRLRPGRAPMGRRRHDRAAALVPTTAHPLGDT